MSGPTVLGPDLTSDVVAKSAVVSALVAGATVPEAASRADVKLNTVRHWKAHDEQFNSMLEQAQERAVNAIIDEGVSHVRQRIKELGPEALAVLKESLSSHDERLRLQAAQAVFRLGGVQEKDFSQKMVGLESQVAALGDKHADSD